MFPKLHKTILDWWQFLFSTQVRVQNNKGSALKIYINFDIAENFHCIFYEIEVWNKLEFLKKSLHHR